MRGIIRDSRVNNGCESKDFLTLEFDDGSSQECGILGVFEALGKEYIALNPLGTDDVYIYGYGEHGEDYNLIDITDEEEFKRAKARYEEITDSMPVEDMVLIDWFLE